VHTKFYGAEYLDANEGLIRTYNGPKLMSSANRKGYHNVDNRGNAQMYTFGIRLYGNDVQCLVGTAPNTYVTRRAVKAWHDARALMYRRAGISMKTLGYGRNLRPYLDVNHENGTTTEIDTETDTVGTDASGINPGYTGDEWTYSRAAVATPIENPGSLTADIHSADLTDTYSFTLCDASVVESTTADDPDESTGVSQADSFVSVGMLSEWLGSFKKGSLPSNDAKAVDSDNALLQLISQQGAEKEEVLELAKDAQIEARPWDLGGASHYSTVAQAYLLANTGESSYQIFQAPCGLFNLIFANGSTAQGARFDLEVLDIKDM